MTRINCGNVSLIMFVKWRTSWHDHTALKRGKQFSEHSNKTKNQYADSDWFVDFLGETGGQRNEAGRNAYRIWCTLSFPCRNHTGGWRGKPYQHEQLWFLQWITTDLKQLCLTKEEICGKVHFYADNMALLLSKAVFGKISRMKSKRINPNSRNLDVQ